MGCIQNLICGHRRHHFAISLLVLFIFISSHSRSFNAEGRKLARTADSSKTTLKEEKTILRARIGSRPPRCQLRCSSCAHCEAVQVPTNPQTRNGIKNSTAVSAIAYARGDDTSNYKPMSWKCKCGNLIFNP